MYLIDRRSGVWFRVEGLAQLTPDKHGHHWPFPGGPQYVYSTTGAEGVRPQISTAGKLLQQYLAIQRGGR